MKLQLKRSSVLDSGSAKAPTAGQMEYGELAVNYNTADVQLFIKDSDNNVVSVTALYAPLASPAFTGTVTGPTINASTALQIGGVAITSTAAELNILDGVTSTAAELNILDGVTATAAELNILDGVTATNTELNYSSGVTSGIQNQIDTKAPKASPAFTGDATLAGDLTINTDALFVDASATKVGIGTASPSVLLHVKESSGDHANVILENSEGSAKLGTNSNVFYVESSQHIFYNVGASTEYARIDSSGNVGIGTASPGSNLQVVGAAQDQIRFGPSTSVYTDAWMGTGFTVFDSIGGTSGAFDFRDNGTSRMFIDSSGNVGIGESSPDTTLHIDSQGATTTLKITSDTESSIDFEDHGGSAIRYKIGTNIDSNDSQFSIKDVTADSERMRIDSSGNVGIGTSNPNAILHTSVNAADATTLYLENRADTGSADKNGIVFALRRSGGWPFYGARIRAEKENVWTGTPTTINSALTFSTIGQETTAERMRIDSSGNVGIGTTSPSDKLEIEGDNGGYSFRVDAETTPVTIRSEDNTGSAFGAIRFTAGNASTESERMRIDSSGQILIKDVNAGTYADFSASGRGEYNESTGTTQKIIFPNEFAAGNDDTRQKLYLFNSGGTRQAIGTGNDYDFTYHSSGQVANKAKHRFYIDEVETVTINTYGLTFNGDTAQANALDDYEEGTWTPVNTDSGAAFTGGGALYTKIGRFVYVSGDATLPTNSSTGAFNITGLPFATTSLGGGFTMYVTASVGTIAFRNQTNTTNMLATQGTNQDGGLNSASLSGQNLQFSFFYVV